MGSIKIDNEAFFGVVEELLNEGNQVQFTVKGKSMAPFILEGTKVLLLPVKAEALHLGDVVLARWQGKWILHRLIYKQWDRIYLVGDNNLLQIEKVKNSDVLAAAVSYVNRQGQITSFKNKDRFLGILWFMLRPFRIIFAKLHSIISKKRS